MKNGHIQRLEEASKVYAKVQRHIQNHTVQELQFYPEHDKRLETPAYKATHDRLVHDQKRACLVCGVNVDTLKDAAKNPYGAKQMETHHHIIEWSLMNAIDPAKFNTDLRPNLARRHPAKAIYQRDMTAQEITDWVDHDEDNLWVLCDVHHRARYLGIHEITYPIWSPMDLLKPDFEAWAKGEIARINKLPGSPI